MVWLFAICAIIGLGTAIALSIWIYKLKASVQSATEKYIYAKAQIAEVRITLAAIRGERDFAKKQLKVLQTNFEKIVSMVEDGVFDDANFFLDFFNKLPASETTRNLSGNKTPVHPSADSDTAKIS